MHDSKIQHYVDISTEPDLERGNGLRRILCLSRNPMPESFGQRLNSAGWSLVAAPVCHAAREHMSRLRIGLVYFDPFDADLLRDWESLCQLYPRIQWLALVSKAALTHARLRELIVNRFHDFHTLPVDFNRLALSLGHAHGMAQLQDVTTARKQGVSDDFGLIGDSQPMLQLRQMIRKAASTDVPVLITGESGTGKELVASAIHSESARQRQTFVPVNCAAIPGTLIQSELFGHEKGAFTGATAAKQGRIESAADGTLFLDEIGDLGMEYQANLLRFLQEKCIVRVGGHVEIPVEARVISATHINLEKAIEEGRFRQDLYYRLNVLRIHMPPLRERADDIEALAQHFFEKFRAEKQPQVTGFSTDTIALMRHYNWPGNVREMINRIRNAMILAEGKLITPADIGLKRGVSLHDIPSLEAVRAEAERKVILATLAFTQMNVSEAARILGVTRATLYRLIAKHHINISGTLPNLVALEGGGTHKRHPSRECVAG